LNRLWSSLVLNSRARSSRTTVEREPVGAVHTNQWVIVGVVALIALIIVLLLVFDGGSGGTGGGGY